MHILNSNHCISLMNLSTEYVTIDQASKILNLSKDTLRRWDKKKLLTVQRIGNTHRLFELKQLEALKRRMETDLNPGKFEVLTSGKTSFSVLETFTGAGGMALGFKNAGLQSRICVEIDKNSVQTLRSNHDWEVIHSDIRKVDFNPFRNQFDIVAGGFPCQAFSYAGKGLGFEDVRGTLFYDFARTIKEVQPKIFIAENVRGLLEHDGGNTLRAILMVMGEIGYRVDFKLLKAQFHDVPQKRERLFIIGIHKDLDWDFYFPKENDYTVPLGAALQDVPESLGMNYSEKKKSIMQLIPEGGYWRDLPIELQKEYMGGSFHLSGGKTGMARRLSSKEPSLTLTCNPAQKQTERCHPFETRPLNVREYARVQTFPDYWQFKGSVSSQYRQIGNAVPVNLAYHIGKCIIGMLNQEFDANNMIVSENMPFIRSLEATKKQYELEFL